MIGEIRSSTHDRLSRRARESNSISSLLFARDSNRLDDALPINGTDFDSLLKVFRDTIIPFSRQNAHPRMFGYVQSPGTPLAAFADLLASTLNANLTIWRSAPAPVELERLTIDWIRQILGFDSEAGGLFVSGGSMANLAALAAARQTKDESLGSLAHLCVERDAFFHHQGSGASGNRPGECAARRSRRDASECRSDDLVAKINCRPGGGLCSILRRCECRNRGYRAQSIP